jgi:hypothetical protein
MFSETVAKYPTRTIGNHM